jgi:long-chain acyl-CoA synthetase
MKLYDNALLNSSLEFIDAENGKIFLLNELSNLNFDHDCKALVFAYLDNTIESISVFWSLMRSDHCIALLSPSISNNFKEELEFLYKPVFVFDNTRLELTGHNKIVDKDIFYFKAKTISEKKIDSQIKILLSTSGSTGSPKFVKLSEKNLISNAQSICNYLPIQKSDVTPLNLPIFYSYGLSILTSNALKGGKIVCSNDDLMKKEFWENFQKFGYTSFGGVPFVFEMLDRIGFTKKVYNSLRYFTQAGGKLQDVLVKKYAEYAQKNCLKFYVMYGQTEATARMSYLPFEELLNKIGSIGKPIFNGSFDIDPNSSELCYKGPNIYGGYVESPNDLTVYSQPSVLKTGDVARVDSDGYYFITGRIKRFAKIFGNRINLDEIESILYKNFKQDFKCVCNNDKDLLIFTDVVDNNLIGAKDYVSKELKLHMSVIKTKFIESIPLTVNGKVDYKELINIYGVR